MRLHPITWLMIAAATLRLAGDCVSLTALGGALVTLDPDLVLSTSERVLMFGQYGGWILKGLAESVTALAMAFWIEALVRIHAALQARNIALAKD